MKLKEWWLASRRKEMGCDWDREWVFTLSILSLCPPSRLTDWCWWHLSLISAYLHLLPQIQAVVWLWKTLGQVLKCIHERLLWENCVIFASEWCNSKAMIESKTITMKQFSMPHTFHIFSDILYLVCAEDCQEPWVMGLLSTGNISHSERWAESCETNNF